MWLGFCRNSAQDFAEVVAGKRGSMSISRAGHASHVARKLTDIVKLPILKREPTAKIAEIWKTYHEGRGDAIGRDIPAKTAQVLVDRAGAAPTFLFPVFRDAGHFMLLSQFQNRRHFIFTFLEDYKKNPALARPYLTLTMHDELANDKDIVLLRGDVEKQMLKEEADHVVSQVVESYCIASRYSSNSGALTFNQNPNAFDLDGMMKFYPKPPGAARS